MKTYTKKNKWFILLVFFGLVITFFFYGKVIFNPGTYLFSNSGDGLKNMYSYMYHLEHDQSYMDFSGVNYPYGESMNYTDGYPLFSWFYQTFPALKSLAIPTINLLLVFSFLICAIILFKIFEYLKVHPFVALVGSLGIAFMAPQMMRMTGHLSLTHSFFFPLGFYLFLRFLNENKKGLFTFLIFLNTFLWTFIHPYLGAILSLFFAVSWMVMIICSKEVDRRKLVTYLHFGVQAILPLLLFKLIIIMTDFHGFRTTYPWGFFVFYSDWKSILLPSQEPLFEPLSHLFDLSSTAWEGSAYIGVAGWFGIILTVIAIVNPFTKSSRKSRMKKLFGQHFGIFIISAIVLLIYAFCFPFRYKLALLADYLGPLRQFRSLGRFSWAFYFIFLIYSVRLFNLYFRYFIRKNRLVKAWSYLFIPLLLLVEGTAMHSANSKRFDKLNVFNYSLLPGDLKEAIQSIKKEKYQAILPVPYFNYGSEIYVQGTDKTVSYYTQLYSYHLGIPHMGVNTPRTAVQESRKLNQMFSAPYYPREIKPDITDNRPFLIVVNPSGKMDENEKLILDKASLLAKIKDHWIYEISRHSLLEDEKELFFSQVDKVIDFNINQDNFWVDDSTKFFFSKEEMLSYQFNRINTMAKFNGAELGKDKTFEISLWCEVDTVKGMGVPVVIQQENDSTGKIKYLDRTEFKKIKTFCGNLGRVDLHFTSKGEGFHYQLFTGHSSKREKMKIGKVMVREEGLNVCKEKDGVVNLNNHLIQRSSQKK